MTYKILTASLLAASLGTGALAQASLDTSTTGTVAGDVGVNAQAGAQADMGNKSDMNYGQIISGLQNGSSSASNWSTELAALDENATVEIVKLSDLKGHAAENSAALDEALKNDEANATAARMEIESNETLKVALENQDYTPDDVVAVQVDGTSQVTLVVDDKA